MNRCKFDLILEECLNRMDRGESLQDVLDSYPLLNGHLEPLVRAALLGRRLPRPVPSKDGFRTGKNMLLAEMNNMRQANSSRQKRSSPASSRLAESWLGSVARLFQVKRTASLAPVYRFVVIGLVLVLGGGFLTVNTSASSLPGDPLYDLKLGLEQTQVFFTFDPEAKQELALEIEQERLSEVELLLAAGRQEEVEFGGVIEQKSESFLVIKGISVQIGPVTELKGDLEIGSVVDVAATTLEDGTLQASDISAAVGDLEDDKDKDKEKDKEDKEKDKEDKEKDKEDKDKDKDK